MTLNSLEGQLFTKPIKEEMNRLLCLEHKSNKQDLNVVIVRLKEEAHEDALAIVKEELHNRLQVKTTCPLEAKMLGKLIENYN